MAEKTADALNQRDFSSVELFAGAGNFPARHDGPGRLHCDFPNKSGLREVAHRLLFTAVTGSDRPSGG
jgi:hypothetical protein